MVDLGHDVVSSKTHLDFQDNQIDFQDGPGLMETCSLRLVLVLVKFLPSGFGQNVLAFKRDLYWWWFVGDFGSLGGSKKPTKKPLRSPQVWSRFGEPKFAGVSPSCAWGVRWGTLATAPGGTLVLFLCNFFGCIKDRREQKKTEPIHQSLVYFFDFDASRGNCEGVLSPQSWRA